MCQTAAGAACGRGRPAAPDRYQRAALPGGLFVKPIAQVMRRRSGVVVAVGTAASLLVLGAGSAGAATLQPAPSPAPLPALAAVPQGIGSAALQGARIIGQTAAQARETLSCVLAPRNLGILVRNVN